MEREVNVANYRPSNHLERRFGVDVNASAVYCHSATQFHCFCTDKEADNGDREEPRPQGHDLAAASGESGKDGVLGSVRLRAGPSVLSAVEMIVVQLVVASRSSCVRLYTVQKHIG